MDNILNFVSLKIHKLTFTSILKLTKHVWFYWTQMHYVARGSEQENK